MNRLDSNGPVVVIGAGPAGTSMAVYLAQMGYDVTVHESRPDMRRTDISAGRSINLALANRGIAVLEDLGAASMVDSITIPMRGRMVHVDGGTNLQPYGQRPSEVIQSVSRVGLNSILLDVAEATGRVEFSFESRCRSVDLEARTMVVTDADDVPHTIGFGTIIGTDGSASAVRDAMESSGASSVRIDPLGHGYKELTIPPADDGSFRIDPNALHIWPRGEFMAIALANPSGDFTATLFMPAVGGDHSFESVVDADSARRFFAGEFPELVSLIPDLTEQWTSNPVGNLATVRTAGWSHEDAAVLVGDAAHAIVPFHGQGMNAAMESCKVMATHLRSSPSVAAAFRAFESERRPDTDAIADMAIDNYIEMRASVVDPSYLLRRSLALELERRWPEKVSPRYSMVMFTTMGYAEARERARRLGLILDELTEGVVSIDGVDFTRAEEMVRDIKVLPTGVRGFE